MAEPTDPPERPVKLCECGCGEPIPLVKHNYPGGGRIKGQQSSARFLRGHHLRVMRPVWWKGDAAGYGALHTWLRKHHPKTGICEECGTGSCTDYALIHGQEHARDRKRYRELCRRCHVIYDRTGGRRWQGTVTARQVAGPEPLCMCGCGTPAGWDSGHSRWRRFASGHRLTRRPVPQLAIITCRHCGRSFTPRRKDTQFCSKACKAARRRAERRDDVGQACHQCGSLFTANRYDRTHHCSKKCAATCQHAGGCPG